MSFGTGIVVEVLAAAAGLDALVGVPLPQNVHEVVEVPWIASLDARGRPHELEAAPLDHAATPSVGHAGLDARLDEAQVLVPP